MANAPCIQPKSQLGRIVLSRYDEGAVLIPIKAHFDGSNSGAGWKKSRFVTVAGYAIDDDSLSVFEDGWGQVLRDDRRRPRAPYLHMKEIRNNQPGKPFSAANGWDDTKREILVSDLIDYMSSWDKTKNRYFSCGVDSEAVIKRQKLKPFPSAVRICTHFCCSYVMKWYIDNYPGLFTGIHAFFDNNEPFKGDFEKLRQLIVADRFETHTNRESWELVKTGTDAYSFVDYAGLQAADLLAWATLRQMEPSGFLNGLAVRIKREEFTSWTIWNDSNLDDVLDKVPMNRGQRIIAP